MKIKIPNHRPKKSWAIMALIFLVIFPSMALAEEAVVLSSGDKIGRAHV